MTKAQRYEDLQLTLGRIARDVHAGAGSPRDAETVALAALLFGEFADAAKLAERLDAEPELEPARAPKAKAKPATAAQHRHAFDEKGMCGCGAKKSARGRKPAGSVPAGTSAALPGVVEKDYVAPMAPVTEDVPA